MGKELTIKAALLEAAAYLKNQGLESPGLEAQVLLAHVLGWDRVRLLSRLEKSLDEKNRDHFQKLVHKRGMGYPLQYLTGHQEFMSLDFLVTPQVLIPRDDTEILVQAALDLKKALPEKVQLVDVGTGSGVVAVTLKKYWPQAQVFAVDISEEALQVAQQNAQRHQVFIHFLPSDLLQTFLTGGKGKTFFHLVVSNPPYIPSSHLPTLQKEVTFEPALALDGGQDGLKFYRRLVQEGWQVLYPGGWLLVEIGWDQGPAVEELFLRQGYRQVKILPDFQGRHRVVLGQKPI